jgi:hypothetical protein
MAARVIQVEASELFDFVRCSPTGRKGRHQTQLISNDIFCYSTGPAQPGYYVFVGSSAHREFLRPRSTASIQDTHMVVLNALRKCKTEATSADKMSPQSSFMVGLRLKLDGEDLGVTTLNNTMGFAVTSDQPTCQRNQSFRSSRLYCTFRNLIKTVQ